MPNCRDIELMLQDYLEGDLLESQRKLLEGHLDACPSCRALLAEMQNLEGGLADLPTVEVPGDLGDRILASLPAAPPAPALRHSMMRQAGMLLAAMAVITFGFLVGTRYGIQSQKGARTIEIAFVAPAAHSVSVVGDFNDWDSTRNRMERSDEEGIWRIRLKLPPGVYEYGFLIDGQDWSKDPGAERFLADGFGGENSILFVEG